MWGRSVVVLWVPLSEVLEHTIRHAVIQTSHQDLKKKKKKKDSKIKTTNTLIGSRSERIKSWSREVR